MTSRIRHILMLVIVTAFAAGFIGNSRAAYACPNCKFANETEKDRPRAYMYSILFMIGMPATIFTGFGLSFYRMVRKAQQAADAEAAVAADAIVAAETTTQQVD